MRAAMVESKKANEHGVPQARKRCLCFLKQGGKVYTTMILNAKAETLLPIIEVEGSTRQCGVHRQL